MTLPEPALQFLFSRVAWAIVLASVAVSVAARRDAFARRGLATLGLAAALPQVLPGAWSPAYWLGLPFQAPSALTTALCALTLRRRWLGRPATGLLPLPFAAVLAASGAWLYLDAFGWFTIGVYYLGFDAFSAPLAALVLASLCVLAIARGTAGEPAGALFASAAAFMAARLPTGNLWDAVIDPFLWVWAVLVCAKAAHARWRSVVDRRNPAS